MKKILVPTDFSECADKASQVAIKISRMIGTEIHFLHIADVPVDWFTMEDNENMYPEVTKNIKHFQSKLESLVQDASTASVAATNRLAFNKNYQGILQYIEEEQVDMVIMGSKGATGLKELLVGSNTQKIVRVSPVPVLVVKEDLTDRFNLEHMVFVSDFNEEVMDQFKKYVAFVRSLNAKLSLLFINTPENFTDSLTTKIKLGNYAMHAPGVVQNTHVFNSYNFLDGLNLFCDENNVDAVGMITHGGTSGMHLFSGSLTEKVVNHSELPVLTMHFS